MGEKSIEIGGETFDLSDPEQKKAAIRAWLKAKAREKKPDESPVPGGGSPDIFAPASTGYGTAKFPEP
jgi:hypothetical protein